MDFERRIIVSLILFFIFIFIIRQRNLILREEKRQALAKANSLANLKCDVITLDLTCQEEEILNVLAKLKKETTNQYLRSCIKNEIKNQSQKS